MKKNPPVYDPVPYNEAVVGAIQALERGECPEHQQKNALRWIIEVAAGTYDQSFRDTERETCFAEGRRFVGNTIVKMLKVDPKKLRSKSNG